MRKLISKMEKGEKERDAFANHAAGGPQMCWDLFVRALLKGEMVHFINGVVHPCPPPSGLIKLHRFFFVFIIWNWNFKKKKKTNAGNTHWTLSLKRRLIHAHSCALKTSPFHRVGGFSMHLRPAIFYF